MVSSQDKEVDSEKARVDSLELQVIEQRPVEVVGGIEAAAVDFPEGGLRAWSVLLGV